MISNKVVKQKAKLPQKVILVLQLLIEELLMNGGTIKQQWPNYGKFKQKKKDNCWHCHLFKGKPTYVTCWRVDKFRKEIEVYYVGTHEKAPY